MANIKIEIAENGTTTLATAGKYCDRNIDVEVNVAGGGGDIEVEPIVLTGNQSYGCAGPMAATYIELFGDTITTSDITNASYMFNNSTLTTIPFSINMKPDTTVQTQQIFNNCYNLIEVPEVNNLKVQDISNFFNYCHSLREIPEEFGEDWDWSYMTSQTSQYNGIQKCIFQGCRSLRKAPLTLMKQGNPNAAYSYGIYYNAFYECNALDEIINMPFPHYNATWTSNALNAMVGDCFRLKRFTFALQEDGSPYVMNWKNQTITFSSAGHATSSYYKYRMLDYNSGITADKEVKDDATYQALKNDPDWFTCDANYSRYNHDSAVETINSLPDTSAYLATAGGTNTIKFPGAAGAKTDGGAINTLTAEEIAVATAKGWTVSF